MREQGGESGESGETLIELLVTLLMMGIAVIGILSGLVTVARLADHNAKTTNVSNTAQSYVEQLKQPVTATTTGYTYTSCATTYPAFSGTLPNATYTATIVDIDYVSTIPTGAAGGSATWSDAGCSADKGLQRLEVNVQVTSATGTITETLAIVKRDARCTYSSAFVNTDQGPC